MKKGFIKVIAFFLSSYAFLLSGIYTFASEKSYNWYVKRNSEHVQPSIDTPLSFISELGGYYVDKKADENSQSRVIYLTFDAGYENGNIARILDVLKEEEVVACFFVLSHLINSEPLLVKRMADEGHTVANHTASHKDMTALSKEEFCSELSDLENIYREKTGRELDKFYRPPRGEFNRSNLEWAREMGYKTIFWSFAYEDWDNKNQPEDEYALNKIFDNIHNGEIMLLHPTSDTNARILKTLIARLREEGYSFGSLCELD